MSDRHPEDDYFTRLDREKKAKLKRQLAEEAAAAEAAERKRLHHHRCGKCGSEMGTRAFRGVEIEVCRACGAVLLDKGELEQLAGEDQSGFLASMFESIFTKR